MPHSVPSGGPVSPALKGMPGLEQVCSKERPTPPDLPKFPLLSPLEERIKQSGVEIPTIFVTNFRNTFTEVSAQHQCFKRRMRNVQKYPPSLSPTPGTCIQRLVCSTSVSKREVLYWCRSTYTGVRTSVFKREVFQWCRSACTDVSTSGPGPFCA